jgi:hypothetical protein
MVAGPRDLVAAFRHFARHASPCILMTTVAIALAVRLSLGPPGWRDAVVLLGILLLWPVHEWLLHVHVLHQPARRIFGRRFEFEQARLHRAHHLDPTNLEILFVPLHTYLYGVPLIVGLAFLLSPDTSTAASAFLVYFALALRYEWIHFLVHTPYAPRTRAYRRLWRNHRLHHFRDERRWLGVSMLAGDRLFGTGGPPDQDEARDSRS